MNLRLVAILVCLPIMGTLAAWAEKQTVYNKEGGGRSCVVTFDIHNGDGYFSRQNVEAGTTLPGSVSLMRKGYVLDRWTTDEAGKRTWHFGTNGDRVTDNMTLYPQWRNDMARATANRLFSLMETGRPLTPAVTLTDSYTGQVLRENRDYVLSYIDNVSPGLATVLLTGTGEWSGTMRLSFTILSQGRPSSLPAPVVAEAEVEALSFFAVEPDKEGIRIEASRAAELRLTNADGVLLANKQIRAGTTYVMLQSGVYTVSLEEKRWKVMVR